jgi:hypothetical protein
MISMHLLANGAAPHEEHVVSPSELRQSLRTAIEGRKANLSKIETLLQREPVRQALQTVRIDGDQVIRSAAQLSDEELARLAARAAQADRDIAAGALSNQELTYIVIALATAVIILVILKA